MSAYIVSENHIIYLVAAALSSRISRGAHGKFTWWNKEPKEITQWDPVNAAAFASELWQENVKSVNYRYPNDPAPIDLFTITPNKLDDMLNAWDFEPVQVLKAANCLEYQSCEHPEWEESIALSFLNRLRGEAIASLVGYSDAAWGSPKTRHQIRAEHFATA
jgi:hypothetical protein